MNGEERPTGVTIVAILNFIGGALAILGGVVIIALGPVLVGTVVKYGIPASKLSAVTAILGVVAVVYFIAGVINIVVGYGLLKGMKWSYWIVVIFSAIGVILSIVSVVMGSIPSIIGAVIDGIILYYFMRPHVKAYFGV